MQATLYHQRIMTLEELLSDVLCPLLDHSEANVELVGVEDKVVTLRVSGKAAFGPEATLLQEKLIVPAVQKVVDGAEVKFEQKWARPNAPR